MSTPMGRDTAVPDVSDIGVGEVLKNLSGDLSKLVGQEVELAKLEVRAEAKKAGIMAGAYGGAGAAAYFAVLFLSLTLAFLLASLLDSWWLGALIVTVVWGVVGGVLFALAKKKQTELNPVPERTVETLKEDKEWLKTRKN